MLVAITPNIKEDQKISRKELSAAEPQRNGKEF
jgi:hypothetical protein